MRNANAIARCNEGGVTMREKEVLYAKRALRVKAVGIVAGVMTAVVMAMCWCSAVM